MSKSDEMMVVRITLRKHIAERLRRMCHARGETASELIDRWIFAHDDCGEPVKRQSETGAIDFRDMISETLRKRGHQ